MANLKPLSDVLNFKIERRCKEVASQYVDTLVDIMTGVWPDEGEPTEEEVVIFTTQMMTKLSVAINLEIGKRFNDKE